MRLECGISAAFRICTMNVNTICKNILIVSLSIILTGCSSEPQNYEVVKVSQQSMTKEEVSFEPTDGYEGEMKVTLLDAYYTRNLLMHELNMNALSATCPNATIQNNDGIKLLSYSECFSDETNGLLIEDCNILILKLRVDNIDATSIWEDEYDNAYIFRADMFELCYVSDEETVFTLEQNIDYFSLWQDDDHKWCTYEILPGESITFEIGFLIGNVLQSKSDVKEDFLKDKDFPMMSVPRILRWPEHPLYCRSGGRINC